MRMIDLLPRLHKNNNNNIVKNPNWPEASQLAIYKRSPPTNSGLVPSLVEFADGPRPFSNRVFLRKTPGFRLFKKAKIQVALNSCCL